VESIVKFFITFNFKFSALHLHVKRTLDTFRSPFWLKEKRWYVAFHNNCLFSIPYFLPVHIDCINQLRFDSTSPDDTIIYQRLNKFTVNKFPTKHNYRFNHIKTLELEFSISFEILTFLIDLNQIKHLILFSLDNLLIFIPLKSRLPQLDELTMINNVTIDMIDVMRDYQFDQICKVEIRVAAEYIECIVEELFRLFPHTEHFVYKSIIYSVAMMIHLINGFKSLSNASFSGDCSFFYEESDFCRNPNLIFQQSHPHKRDNITCRVYHIPRPSLPFDIYWRIEKPVSIP
jgi:hypothetical protein